MTDPANDNPGGVPDRTMRMIDASAAVAGEMRAIVRQWPEGTATLEAIIQVAATAATLIVVQSTLEAGRDDVVNSGKLREEFVELCGIGYDATLAAILAGLPAAGSKPS